MNDDPPPPSDAPALTDPREPRPGFYIGTLRGIRFYLDYSWFVIAAVITYELSVKYFPASLPGRATAVYAVFGVATALLFFLSILLHELGHSVVSQRCGIPVPRITLLFIGGLAEISREPDDARSELKIAVAGPAVSALLVVFYGGLAWLSGRLGFHGAKTMLGWLSSINLALLVFNAIPGYPLDGGRVLRAVLWARSGNLRRATYVASRVGIVFSWVLMGLGVFLLAQGHWDAFVYLLIGMFLRSAAESGYLQAVNHEILSGIRVRDIMSPNPACIPARMPVSLAVDEFFLAKHHVAFPVCDDDGGFQGLLRLEFLQTLPREKWPYTSAGDLASSSDRLSISAEELAADAMRRLLTPGESRLAVIDSGKLVGMVTRHDILHFIKIHTALE
jgi:Zn-dependent protease/CBS domain-containing protein